MAEILDVFDWVLTLQQSYKNTRLAEHEIVHCALPINGKLQ